MEFRKKDILTAAALGLSVSVATGCSFEVQALTLDHTPVGMTYYGGHYDEQQHKWIVDNKDQCDRIKTGELSAESLRATPTEACDDDPGVGYFDYIPLHNTMSYAELSIDPDKEDFSALGDLPARTRLEVEYDGRCVVLEKLDVGTGGYAVEGHRRSIDLWWQTARSLGFTNGFDVAKVSYIDQGTPLTPLGQTSPCIVKAAALPPVDAPLLVPEAAEKQVEPEVGSEKSHNSNNDLKPPESEENTQNNFLPHAIGAMAILAGSLGGWILYARRGRG